METPPQQPEEQADGVGWRRVVDVPAQRMQAVWGRLCAGIGRLWSRGLVYRLLLIAAVPFLCICSCCSASLAFTATPYGQQLTRETEATDTASALSTSSARATAAQYARLHPKPKLTPTSTHPAEKTPSPASTPVPTATATAAPTDTPVPPTTTPRTLVPEVPTLAPVRNPPTPTPTATRVLPKPTPAPTRTPPTPTPTPKRPPPTPTPPAPTPCANPCNPWGYNFAPGNLIYRPPANFCNYFNCIPSFWKQTNGFVEECQDATFSHSGGRRGSCSDHGGNWRALYSH